MVKNDEASEELARRSRSSSKPNYRVDELPEEERVEDDDEYNDDNEDDEEEITVRSRGRRHVDEEEDDEDDEDDLDDENEDGEGEHDEETPAETSAGAETSASMPPLKKRGRPRKRPRPEEEGAFYGEGSVEYDSIPEKKKLKAQVVDDGYVLLDDEEGDTHIDADGVLLGGRQFKVRTFTVAGKGNRQYMLATEPARCVGFRDSYLFFQRHTNLYKYVVTEEEKFELIDRGQLPYSYKSRTIGLVTARSVYKEFGARIIINGRYITDDYYASRLRKEGKVVEGELVYPQDRNANPNSHLVPGLIRDGPELGDTRTMLMPSSSGHVNQENWIFQHAQACSKFNSDIFEDRERVLLKENHGLRDPYTAIVHLPGATQPARARYTKIGSSKRIICDIVVSSTDLTGKATGLADVPLDVFDGHVSEEVKAAILAQQEYEKSLYK